MKPQQRPLRPEFSSGPCAKRPGWSLEVLQGAALGRSHRSKLGRARLGEVIDRTRELLGLPAGYREVLILHDIEGYTHEEISSAMGTQVGTSKAQLSRARARLREALSEFAGEWAS